MWLGNLGAVTAQQATNQVTAAFQTLFGRSPAAGGLSFWVNALTSGSVAPADLQAQMLDDASAADLAYYNAHHGAASSPTPAPAPVSQSSIIAAAQANPNAYILTPGVNSYADMQRTVYQTVGEDGGIYSIPQTWVDVTGHTDQYWQQVQAAYTAGQHPTTTTFTDTWLASVPTGSVGEGSAAAIANMMTVLPVYTQYLTNLGESAATIAYMLAQRGIGGASTVQAPAPAALPTSAAAMTIVPSATNTAAPAQTNSATATVGTGTVNATGLTSSLGPTAAPTASVAVSAPTSAGNIGDDPDAVAPSTDATVVSVGASSSVMGMVGLAVAAFLLLKK